MSQIRCPSGRTGMSTESSSPARVPAAKFERRVGGPGSWLDDRLGVARLVRPHLRKVFPDHWSFLLGENALWRNDQCSGNTLRDRKSTRLNSSHVASSYAVFCWKNKS